MLTGSEGVFNNRHILTEMSVKGIFTDLLNLSPSCCHFQRISWAPVLLALREYEDTMLRNSKPVAVRSRESEEGIQYIVDVFPKGCVPSKEGSHGNERQSVVYNVNALHKFNFSLFLAMCKFMSKVWKLQDLYIKLGSNDEHQIVRLF